MEIMQSEFHEKLKNQSPTKAIQLEDTYSSEVSFIGGTIRMLSLLKGG